MFAARITLPHLSVFAAISIPKSAGDPKYLGAKFGEPSLESESRDGINLLLETIDIADGGRIPRRDHAIHVLLNLAHARHSGSPAGLEAACAVRQGA